MVQDEIWPVRQGGTVQNPMRLEFSGTVGEMTPTAVGSNLWMG